MESICSKTVMDTTAGDLNFDSNGVCNLYREFEAKKTLYSNFELNKIQLNRLISKIKKRGVGHEYDCIIGISGGVDSSCLAVLAVKEWGLRPLFVHVDTGWNSIVSVNNIKNLIDTLGVDLKTIVINWPEMMDLQLAFFKSGLPGLDTPQDHVFHSLLYGTAKKFGIKYILNGCNYQTESFLPKNWGYDVTDATLIKDVHRRFGTKDLKTYPFMSLFQYQVYYPFICGIKNIDPLNLVVYKKSEAVAQLESNFGWKSYKVKHGESVFTKFFQNYWLVERFGFDKRKAHLSSLIANSEISREDALEELNKELYSEVELNNEKLFICNKLGITLEDLDVFFNLRKASPSDFKNQIKLKKYLKQLASFFRY